MNKAIRVKGWIAEAYKKEDKYILKIHPEFYGIFEEIEDLVLQKKLEAEEPFLREQVTSKYKDRLFDKAKVVFETLIKPKLTGDLQRVQSEVDLIGKFVEAVGHIQVLKSGNAFLSVHIIDPATRSVDLDPHSSLT